MLLFGTPYGSTPDSLLRIVGSINVPEKLHIKAGFSLEDSITIHSSIVLSNKKQTFETLESLHYIYTKVTSHNYQNGYRNL